MQTSSQKYNHWLSAIYSLGGSPDSSGDGASDACSGVWSALDFCSHTRGNQFPAIAARKEQGPTLSYEVS